MLKKTKTNMFVSKFKTKVVNYFELNASETSFIVLKDNFDKMEYYSETTNHSRSQSCTQSRSISRPNSLTPSLEVTPRDSIASTLYRTKIVIHFLS